MNSRIKIDAHGTTITGQVEIWYRVDDKPFYSVHSPQDIKDFVAVNRNYTDSTYRQQLAGFVASLSSAQQLAGFTSSELQMFNFYNSFSEGLTAAKEQPDFMGAKTWQRYLQWVEIQSGNQYKTIN